MKGCRRLGALDRKTGESYPHCCRTCREGGDGGAGTGHGPACDAEYRVPRPPRRPRQEREHCTLRMGWQHATPDPTEAAALPAPPPRPETPAGKGAAVGPVRERDGGAGGQPSHEGGAAAPGGPDAPRRCERDARRGPPCVATGVRGPSSRRGRGRGAGRDRRRPEAAPSPNGRTSPRPRPLEPAFTAGGESARSEARAGGRESLSSRGSPSSSGEGAGRFAGRATAGRDPGTRRRPSIGIAPAGPAALKHNVVYP